MKSVRLNWQVLLESLSCGAFGIVLLYLVLTRKYLAYVTPRNNAFLLFSSIMLLIWSVHGLHRLFWLQYKMRVNQCLALILPMLLILLPHRSLKAADFTIAQANNTVTAITKKQPAAAAGNAKRDKPDMPIVTEKPLNEHLEPQAEDNSMNEVLPDETVQEELPPKKDNSDLDWDELPISETLPGLDLNSKKITVSNDLYGEWVYELFNKLNLYEGYTIEITGYVYQEEETAGQNRFLLARLAMVCCAADLFPFGLISYSDHLDVKPEGWITMEGVIQIRSNGEYNEPQVVVKRIKMANEVEGYIYPF